MAFLTLDNLTKRFGDFAAVDALSLTIDKGEFVSLLGPSGCGKTTTLQMIAGLHEPNAGRIHLEGQDITDVPPNKRGLGIVFQSYALFPHMTAADNVGFGLEMRGVNGAERTDRIERALDQVKLAPFADRYPKELSGGQRQRVALARALVIEPPMLLLDEPLSNLDAKLREEMQLELRLLQQNIGVTTILVTHDQSEALSMSDRVVVMNEGREVQTASPFAMYEAPADAFVSDFVGKTNLFIGQVSHAGQGDEVVVNINEVAIKGLGSKMAQGDYAAISIRPEKITIHQSNIEPGLDATIDASIFHGSHWLYKLSSKLGDMIVTTPNSGGQPFERGTDVKLAWPDNAVRVLAQAKHSD